MPAYTEERTRVLGPLPPNLSKIICFPQEQADDEFASAFFTKLPPEVRRLVYIYVLGGAKFSIILSGQKLVRKRCWVPSGSRFRRPGVPDPSKVMGWGPLSFLQTCHQAILYSTNIFTFDSPRTFNWFASSILSQSRNAIRRLHIDYHVDREAVHALGAATWQRSCDTIAGMPGLEELHIWLIKDDGLVSASDSNIVDPMKAIKGVRDFKVELVWTAEYDWDMYCLM